MKKLGTWALLACLIGLAGCGNSSAPISSEIPNITLPTVDGESFVLKKHLSKTTLLVFWATWCQPCLMEIPSLIKLHQKYKDQGFQVISINTDDPDVDKVGTLKKTFEINYPILISPDEETLSKFGGIRALPTAFFLNSEGKYLEKLEGLTPEFVLEEKINQYLNLTPKP